MDNTAPARVGKSLSPQ